MMHFSTLKHNFKAESHGFHLVSPSPWPYLTSLGIFNLMMYSLLVFHEFDTSDIAYFLSFVYLSFVMGMWFRDVAFEATYQGHHTSKVQKGLRLGMILFLVSEVMFFFSFFWCFFYMAISPSVWIGCVWPPLGIQPLNPFLLPLLNTLMLLSSGVSATFAHTAMLTSTGSKDVFMGLGVSVGLGVLFTLCQLWEYANATFSMNDGIYGSMFYVSTGFHGLHVIMGTTAMIVCVMRHYLYHFQMEHHLGFEFSLWYWHFVDVVWILLYFFVYIWGSNAL